jgi:hypothetical protein
VRIHPAFSFLVVHGRKDLQSLACEHRG